MIKAERFEDTCKIKSCNNFARQRTRHPSKEQIAYLNAESHYYYICKKCEGKGWKYNTVDDEYYFRPPTIMNVGLSSKQKIS